MPWRAHIDPQVPLETGGCLEDRQELLGVIIRRDAVDRQLPASQAVVDEH